MQAYKEHERGEARRCRRDLGIDAEADQGSGRRWHAHEILPFQPGGRPVERHVEAGDLAPTDANEHATQPKLCRSRGQLNMMMAGATRN